MGGPISGNIGPFGRPLVVIGIYFVPYSVIGLILLQILYTIVTNVFNSIDFSKFFASVNKYIEKLHIIICHNNMVWQYIIVRNNNNNNK